MRDKNAIEWQREYYDGENAWKRHLHEGIMVNENHENNIS